MFKRDRNTVTGQTSVVRLENGDVSKFEIHPEDAKLKVHPLEDILGGTPSENSKSFINLLDGQQGAYRDAVLLNSAAALVVAEKSGDLASGVEIAKESIDSGKAKSTLKKLIKITGG